MKNCLFCDIITGKAPSYKIYENDSILAFLDIFPVTNGHTLIIPKKHSENIFDIDSEILKRVILGVQHVCKILRDKLAPDGIRISQSNGKAAGQAIWHFHVHVIPHYRDDKVLVNQAITVHPSKANEKELINIAEKLRN